ncbi:competence/damage-inducible protein A [Rhodobacter capsulatus]|jgi:molybdenum cofactor synthesis domain-containing protein|uniref:Molybdopterin binding domain protein n=1 Tax=Rhodobacter capsulatus (strain ATCC BAA-309 / NBRC 16581 / SB1003) TaxID=272942 RepID=D5ASR8_RHOCB|nr:competence/damage-inducible protein A [Rhodobacter capsulatus]ADE87159.1 molybdopterin binding domain protein [Rhodobacter capsulatus SB 1003]ETD03387.1 molybdenum cofactor biosynthesis protein [Rhodobacter capsulatus DE442]ETD80182.1 molybdenum cofactor biosynthesis protein [Rhodobacter capsulatus R121]ETE55446.1 molybdenum cofactor biosynthesis protein [Rhodobacter capsulatus Y262]MDS0925256.1 competence/damage-inducible protein A [Rhodobacter capsulatus]
MPNPTCAILIIGDEILTGRTREGNAHHLAGELVKAGFDLRQIRVISDDHPTIVAAVRELSGTHDHLFTSGGIGPTHDDITADAVAEAFGRSIGIRDDARAILAAHYAARGVEFTEARLRMARIPEGASLIDNPVSGAPGFSIGNCHVMAGVPNIFQAMVAGLLPRLAGGQPLLSRNWQMMVAEAAIADALRDLAAAHPAVSFGSYPFVTEGQYGTNLVARSTEPAALDAAFAALQDAFPEGR